MVIGEVGLAGGIRSIPFVPKRLLEAKKLGFSHCLISYGKKNEIEVKEEGLQVMQVKTLKEALGIALV